MITLERWWVRNGETVLRVSLVLMGVLGALKLGTEFHRLTVGTGRYAAIDLGLRWYEVRAWFGGEPIYATLERITYPPQAYVMLWPLVGWLGFTAARWFWAVTSIAMLAWLAALLTRGSGAETSLERAFIALVVVSFNAVGVTVGNGQLTLHILPALVAGLLLLREPRGGWGMDTAAAALLLVAAIKPTLTAPFGWVALFTTRRIRPLVFTCIGYVALTLFASTFQQAPVLALLRQWASQKSSDLHSGYGDLQSALGALGLEQWAMPASLLVLLACGVWIYRNRNADFWILLGVAALVARLWTYHRVYDDVLVLLPMIALFRIAKRGQGVAAHAVQAGLLLGISIIAMLAPARFEFADAPLNWLFIGGHTVIWLAMLWFLVKVAGDYVEAVPQSSQARIAPPHTVAHFGGATTDGG